MGFLHFCLSINKISILDLLGIKDLSSPEYGDAVQAHPGDVPVFWACGVTGIEAVINCSMYLVELPELLYYRKPGMFKSCHSVTSDSS